jgi:hypothetical protein
MKGNFNYLPQFNPTPITCQLTPAPGPHFFPQQAKKYPAISTHIRMFPSANNPSSCILSIPKVRYHIAVSLSILCLTMPLGPGIMITVLRRVL